jgi:hypothetical protein
MSSPTIMEPGDSSSCSQESATGGNSLIVIWTFGALLESCVLISCSVLSLSRYFIFVAANFENVISHRYVNRYSSFSTAIVEMYAKSNFTLAQNLLRGTSVYLCRICTRLNVSYFLLLSFNKPCSVRVFRSHWKPPTTGENYAFSVICTSRNCSIISERTSFLFWLSSLVKIMQCDKRLRDIFNICLPRLCFARIWVFQVLPRLWQSHLGMTHCLHLFF